MVVDSVRAGIVDRDLLLDMESSALDSATDR
jgi:hypothetical protein